MSRIDPVREAAAAKALRDSLASLADDDALLLDMVEGETSLFECIDQLLTRMASDEAQIAGIEAVVSDLEARKGRFKKRRDSDRAIIEQALMIAEIDAKVERPLATLSLSKRAPSLIIETEADIPAQFWKPADPALDRKALTAALKDGKTIPGATLSNGAPSLTIRTK